MPSLFLRDVMPHFKAACSSHGKVARFYSEVACPAVESISTERGHFFCFILGVYFILNVYFYFIFLFS